MGRYSLGWIGFCVGEAQLVAYKYVPLSFELIEQSFPNSNMVSDIFSIHLKL
jgi:hypothetical protein